MKRFNLSAWAVSHPSLVLFLIVALGVAGFFSYQKLGRAEKMMASMNDRREEDIIKKNPFRDYLPGKQDIGLVCLTKNA